MVIITLSLLLLGSGVSKTIRTKELSTLLGVTPQTIRAYASDGRIPFHTTPGGQLMFTPADVKKILGDQPQPATEKWAYYLRSTAGRKTAFENQENLLRGNYPEPIKIYKDSASGLNEQRKSLLKLIEDTQSGKITDIAVTTKDRLTRFGSKYLELLFTQNNVTIHYLSTAKEDSIEQELMSDFMALIASFSGKFYRMRGKENQRKLLELVQEELAREPKA